MSKIEVDAIDKQSGSTLTLGGSGTAVTLACGATQTGFGRTGTVDWQTTQLKQQHLQQLMVKVILLIQQVEHLQYEFTSRFCWSNCICCRLCRNFSNK
jgi:hypothetical protein